MYSRLGEANFKALEHLYGEDRKDAFEKDKEDLGKLVGREKERTEQQMESFLQDLLEHPIQDDDIIRSLLNPILRSEDEGDIELVRKNKKPIQARNKTYAESVATAK